MSDENSEFGKSIDAAFKLFCDFLDCPLSKGRNAYKEKYLGINAIIKNGAEYRLSIFKRTLGRPSQSATNAYILATCFTFARTYYETYSHKPGEIADYALAKLWITQQAKTYCARPENSERNISLEDLKENTRAEILSRVFSRHPKLLLN